MDKERRMGFQMRTKEIERFNVFFLVVWMDEYGFGMLF